MFGSTGLGTFGGKIIATLKRSGGGGVPADALTNKSASLVLTDKTGSMVLTRKAA